MSPNLTNPISANNYRSNKNNQNFKMEEKENIQIRQRDYTPNSNLKNNTHHERKRSFDSKKGISFLDSLQLNQTNSNSNSYKNNLAKEIQKPPSSQGRNFNKNDTNNKSKQNFNQINSLNFIKRFSGKSKAGRTFDGKTKTNQDSFLIKTRIFNLDNFSIFGVFDGHGSHGHYISNMIKLFFNDYYGKPEIFLGKGLNSRMPSSIYNSNSNFKNNLNSQKNANNFLQNSHSTNNIGNGNTNNINEEIIYEKLKEKDSQLIKNSFNVCESSISLSKYDVNFSGSTCVMCFFIENKIICANSGDSRAILITSEKGFDSVVNLSRDHKPDLADEMQRITRANGRVDRYCENGIRSGPFRVWLKGQNYPGLAMSRSICDLVAGSVGVINEPEVFEYEINEFSKYIVIASDGIWEFMSNENVMDIVNYYYTNNFDANAASDKLVEEATKYWKREDESIDDISVLVIFLQPNKY